MQEDLKNRQNFVKCPWETLSIEHAFRAYASCPIFGTCIFSESAAGMSRLAIGAGELLRKLRLIEPPGICVGRSNSSKMGESLVLRVALAFFLK